MARLRIALDVETTKNTDINEAAHHQQEDISSNATGNSPTTTPNRKLSTSDAARHAFIAGQSDERVQALSIIMLFLCSGLQHAQGVAS